jgi:hypothetical protein
MLGVIANNLHRATRRQATLILALRKLSMNLQCQHLIEPVRRHIADNAATNIVAKEKQVAE